MTMEVSKLPNMCSSNSDQSPSSTRIKRLEYASVTKVSLYRSLLRSHREIFFTDDSKSDDEDTHGNRNGRINCGRVGQGRRGGSQEIPHRRCIEGSRNSAVEILVSGETSGIASSPTSLYPRIVDDITGDDHHGLFHRQQCDALERQNCSEESTGNHLTGALLPYQSPRSVHRHDSSDNNATQTAALKPISSFYREALERAVSEEEETLLSQQHQLKRSQEEQSLEMIDDISFIARRANQTISRPSSFYQSAVKEVMMAEEELGTEEGSEENEEYSNMDPVVNQAATSIPRQTCINIPVHEPESRSYLPLDLPDKLDGRVSDRDRAMRFSAFALASVGEDPIHTYQRTPSFADENDESSVTRSMVIPQLTCSVLPPMQEKSVANDMIYDDDCDEELRLAIYLSRFKVSMDEPVHAEKSLSAPISTGGTCDSSEEKIEKEHYYDQHLESFSFIDNNNDFLLSQLKALEDCQKNKRNRGVSQRPTDSSIAAQKHSRSPRETPQSSQPSSLGRVRRDRLETYGVSQTKKAISNGKSHIVECKGCKGRLQAPMHYSLVFCPKCKTVSPA